MNWEGKLLEGAFLYVPTYCATCRKEIMAGDLVMKQDGTHRECYYEAEFRKQAS